MVFGSNPLGRRTNSSAIVGLVLLGTKRTGLPVYKPCASGQVKIVVRYVIVSPCAFCTDCEAVERVETVYVSKPAGDSSADFSCGPASPPEMSGSNLENILSSRLEPTL